jgi:hypothetical protein
MLNPQKTGAAAALLGNTPASYQVNHQHDDCDNQQQVNQPTGHMEAETKKPQNQKHNKNSPKHI